MIWAKDFETWETDTSELPSESDRSQNLNGMEIESIEEEDPMQIDEETDDTEEFEDGSS